MRIDAPTNESKIALDDCGHAIAALVPAAEASAAKEGEKVARVFLVEPVVPYELVPVEEPESFGSRRRRGP